MSAPRSGSGDHRPVLAVITGHLTPYRVHLHRRIAAELREVRLVTLVTKFRTGPWVNPNLPEVGCVMLDPQAPPAADRRGAGLFVHELGTARRTCRWLAEHRPAAVICGGYDELPNIRALVWASRRGVPVFNWSDSSALSDHATGFRRIAKNLIVPRVVSRCTGLLVFGSEGKRFFARYGASAEKVWYAPLEPDYDHIHDMSGATVSHVAAELGLVVGRRRLVCCCRLIPTKRVDLVLDAFATLAAERPEWDLLIAGDGPLRKELEARVAGLLAASRVRFLGFLDQERVTAVYRASDALVLASEIEPWALVVNEAAAAGLAIVTSDIVGAAPELVREGVNGYTFRCGDLPDLTSRLRTLTATDEIDRLKAGSPEVVEEWRRVADPVEGIRTALRSCGVIGKMRRKAVDILDHVREFLKVGRGSILGRVSRAALALVPKRAVVPILQGELKGCKWVVGSSIHGCWLGSFEFEKQQLFKDHVKAGMTVYDIGANVGFYTLLSSRLAGEAGAVYSFEPLPRSLGLLRRHIGMNTNGGGRCAGNVTVIDAAVSDADGTAVFMPDVAPERAHMMGAGDQNVNIEADKREASTKGITVRTVRIDGLATAERGAARSSAALRPPDLMKIDVEGAEEMVLRGAAGTITKYKPTIFLATHGPAVHAACLGLLRAWGYDLAPIGGPDLDSTDEVIAIAKRR